MPAGRPSTYTREKAQAICDRIAGGEFLSFVVKDHGMPDLSTVYRWFDTHPEFREAYVRARERQAEHFAAEIVAIADESPTCEVPSPDGGVTVRIDNAAIQRNRLRVDTRKWIACKLLPKVYGERTAITGEDGGPVELAVRIAEARRRTE